MKNRLKKEENTARKYKKSKKLTNSRIEFKFIAGEQSGSSSGS